MDAAGLRELANLCTPTSTTPQRYVVAQLTSSTAKEHLLRAKSIQKPNPCGRVSEATREPARSHLDAHAQEELTSSVPSAEFPLHM